MTSRLQQQQRVGSMFVGNLEQGECFTGKGGGLRGGNGAGTPQELSYLHIHNIGVLNWHPFFHLMRWTTHVTQRSGNRGKKETMKDGLNDLPNDASVITAASLTSFSAATTQRTTCSKCFLCSFLFPVASRSGSIEAICFRSTGGSKLSILRAGDAPFSLRIYAHSSRSRGGPC